MTIFKIPPLLFGYEIRRSPADRIAAFGRYFERVRAASLAMGP